MVAIGRKGRKKRDGGTFVDRLTVTPPKARRLRPGDNQEGTGITTRRANSILLVDDSAIFRDALRREFQRDGWTVCEAADGVTAIEKGEELHPPIILLDLAMPGINGLATARLLRKTLPEVRLILLTGYGYLFKSTELSSVGIDAVISNNEASCVLQHLCARLLLYPMKLAR